MKERQDNFSDQQALPYVVQMRNGKAINAFGEPVFRTDLQAFVPLEKFVYRSSSDDCEIPKNVWIKNVVDSLKEIASEEYQVKGWVKNEIHDYCTFTEVCCRLFDDIQIDGFFERAKEFGFSDIQIKKTKEAITAFEKFSDEYSGFEDPTIIVNDPAFPQVRKLAKEALASMGITHYLDPSKQIFKDSLLYKVYWISSPEVQKRTWFMEMKAKTNAFEDLMDGFFIGSKASMILDNYKDYEITEGQVNKLQKLYDHLEPYREKAKGEQNLQRILDDPEWHQIQALAQEIVTLFDFNP